MRVFKRNQEDLTVQETNLDEVINFLYDTDEVECDTETWGFDPHSANILSIQFGNTNNQYLIEWDDLLVEILSPFFKNDNKTFIFQNAKFDLQFLYKKNITVTNVYDTLLAEIILTNGLQ